uniref:N-acetyltransferase domain-containing protein n=1 Tax=Hyaloperonospora arabidopsidis (strain Emoy2) TaxID=559515 RepID=M4BEV6_HYAAE
MTDDQKIVCMRATRSDPSDAFSEVLHIARKGAGYASAVQPSLIVPRPLSPAAVLPTSSTENSSEIVIRQYVPDDLAQVTRLFKVCMLTEELHPHVIEDVVNSMKSDFGDIEGTYITPGGNFWIATPHDDPMLIVGIVGLEIKSKTEGKLRQMSVKSTHRRRGIGRQLMSMLEKWAVDRQLQKVWLTTEVVKTTARDFYRSVGYTETEVIVICEDPSFEWVKI